MMIASRRSWMLIALTLAVSSAVGGAALQREAPRAPQVVTLEVPGRANATPSLAVEGRLIAAVWTAAKDGVVDVYAATSRDSGATFSTPVRVNDQPGNATANNEQPPRVAIAAGNERVITVLWSQRDEDAKRARRDVIRLARSADGGRTFTPARATHDAALSGARGWQSLVAAAGGSFDAVWLDGRDAEKKIAEMQAHSGMAHKGQPPQDVFYGRIGADGRVTEHLIATGVCFCCKTAVASDGHGGVYAAWRHIFPGSMRDIAFAKSTDGGSRFTPVVRVSEDKWELNGCPEDGPSIAVDRSGMVHIAWATLVTDGEPQKAVFYATSPDGKTFSPRVRVPAAAPMTNPGHPQLALAAGRAVIVWDETVDGVRRVSMTRMGPAGQFLPAEVVSSGEAALAPVVVAIPSGDLLVAWTSRDAKSGPSAPVSAITLRRLPLR